jgi:beta-glucanase (GH16 family)
MRAISRSRGSAICLCLMLSACGGGGSSTAGGALPAVQSPVSSSPQAPGVASVNISIGGSSASSARRGVRSVPTSAASAVIVVTPASSAVESGQGTLTTMLPCSGSCAGVAQAPIGNDVIEVRLYDQANGGGNMLAQGRTNATIVNGTANRVVLSIGGIVASIVLAVGEPVTAGTVSAIPLTVQAKDASGTAIIGSYASPISLVLSDASGSLALSQTTVGDSSATVSLSYNGSASFSGATLNATAPGASSVVATIAKAATPTVCVDGRVYSSTFDDEFDTFSRYDHATKHGTWDTQYPWGRTNSGTHAVSFNIDKTYTGSGTVPLGVDPFTNSGGTLAIAAAPASASLQPQINDFPYTAGVITTRYSFAQQYGYIEGRMRLEQAQGVNYGFWLMPVYGWPPEIDIMENVGGNPNVVYQTTHAVNNTSQQEVYKGINAASAYHTYGLKWTSTEIAYLVDGVVTARYANVSNVPMYILAGLGVEGPGGWGGTPDSTTPFPTSMHIDYIRAYKDAGSGCTSPSSKRRNSP